MAKLPIRNNRMGYAVGDFVSSVPDQKTTLGVDEKASYVPQVADESVEILPSTTGQLSSTIPTASTTAAGLSDLAVAVPATQSANTYTGYTTLNTPAAQAAQGTMDSRSVIGEPSMTANATRLEQNVSAESQATAAETTVSSLSTVQGQLSNLMAQLNTNGADLPPWAAPAVRKVNAIMNQRGLGASSMASAAITQSIYESALPIASQDAKTYAAIDLANLSNRQASVMQNATVYAGMDKANLDARMKAAVTDQKAVNAADQFNAKSETQVMEFFAELGTQIENANKTRVAAMKQFDASEGNAISKFNTQLDDARDKFNSQMSAQISQGNANWRRQINTSNTAGVNESNRINAQNLLGLSATAQDQQWQRYRDEASWLVTTSENAQDRAHKVALLGQQNTYNIETYEKERWDLLQDMVAETTFTGVLNYITKQT